MPLTDEQIQQLIQALEGSKPEPAIRKASFAQLKPVEKPQKGASLDKLLDIPLKLSVELGRTKMRVREILELEEGSLIVLNRTAGDRVDILVNGRPLGQGEVVVINDAFGVRLGNLAEVPEEET
ncbi:MAG: flagellar motor switch protein FliN [Thermoanaerobacteraceae bacterium]|uniref:flagellar motor switch protein FliN n=1 Tax=Thermanaeromonas sp. C210 TaxID=2731925 RepID=UPI00155BC06B|nr:flagellar motor switch protein FliN [Thermanaeromonas sp. C210]MBE3580476.1 flagellar motor switch protein FliN [Thermoanaerobacteraceae bacterium]GFN24139.1 flagellar motor switch protein FliN [Thermanaeromonas sp. C210]